MTTRQSPWVETVPELKLWQAVWAKCVSNRKPQAELAPLARHGNASVSTQVPFRLWDFALYRFLFPIEKEKKPTINMQQTHGTNELSAFLVLEIRGIVNPRINGLYDCGAYIRGCQSDSKKTSAVVCDVLVIFSRRRHCVLYYPVMLSYFLHSLGNHTRRAIFPKMCKINQSSVDFHCKPFGWLIAWLTVGQFWLDWFIGFVPPDLSLRGWSDST